MPNVNMNLCSEELIEITVNFGAITPLVGSTWQVQDELNNLICAVVNSNEPNPSAIYTPVQEFDTCEECSPQSVNNEYTLCITDCNGDLIELTFPHPVWTNNYGTAVTQLDAVALGGPNGLNN